MLHLVPPDFYRQLTHCCGRMTDETADWEAVMRALSQMIGCTVGFLFV